MTRPHDMGGMRRGRVVVEQHEPVYHEPWEGRVHGMVRRLLAAGLFNLDQFRDAQERLPPEVYQRSSYYERWLAALELLVKETGAVVPRETRRESRATASFTSGDKVITKKTDPPGHTRLPRYARGKRGVVESVHLASRLPDTNAHLLSVDWEPVYTVVFDARELWGREAEAKERVSIDLWQSYLEPDL